MPKSTREWAKRELEAADKNLAWVYFHLGKVIEKYDKEHPEITEPLKLANLALVEVGTLVSNTKASF